MEIKVILKGDLWKLRSNRFTDEMRRKTVELFSAIATENGSQAVWLPETGVLCTEDSDEPAKDFPYGLWRQEAIELAITELRHAHYSFVSHMVSVGA